jgi:predicted esterase
MQKHQLTIPRTARYVTIGEINEQTENVWFVIHGYGQLAEFFIKKFKDLDDGKTVIIAPEALSRFYLKEFSGRVGATWMTREERDSEIMDYINYLNLLYDTVLQNTDVNRLKINILGFSQGTATVARWCMNEHIKYDRLIIWAGYFGNGIQDVIDPKKLTEKEVVLCYGKEDEFLVKIDLNQYENDIQKAIPHVQIHTFDSGHTIDGELLLKIR